MIPDCKTNFLYLANTLQEKYLTFYERLEKVLNECSIGYDLLPQTKDVWAVDYMPVQVGENYFVQFLYDPDYLKPAKWHKTISDVDSICKSINISPVKSDIRIDGGNVVKSPHSVIICDKVFRENPGIKEKQLIKDLYALFQVDKIFFVPQDPHDFTGHADGMVRFLNEKTVLINDLSNESPTFQLSFRLALHNAGLEYIEIPYCPDMSSNDSAKGLYLNYLQMKDVIIVPTFGIKEDDIAVRQLEDLFDGFTVRTVDSNEIASQGGVLNCISWNIKSCKEFIER